MYLDFIYIYEVIMLFCQQYNSDSLDINMVTVIHHYICSISKNIREQIELFRQNNITLPTYHVSNQLVKYS